MVKCASWSLISTTSYSFMTTYFNHFLLLHDHLLHPLLTPSWSIHPLLISSWSLTLPTSYFFMITYFTHFLLLLHLEYHGWTTVLCTESPILFWHHISTWSLLLTVVSAVLWIFFLVGQLHHLLEMPQISFNHFLKSSTLCFLYSVCYCGSLMCRFHTNQLMDANCCRSVVLLLQNYHSN